MNLLSYSGLAKLAVCTEEDITFLLLAGGDLEGVGLVDVLSYYYPPRVRQEFSRDGHDPDGAVLCHLEGLVGEGLNCR